MTSVPMAVPLSTSETARSLRGWVVLAVVALTVLTVVTAFADEMPESHRLAVPLAAAVMMAVHFWRIRKDGGISGPL